MRTAMAQQPMRPMPLVVLTRGMPAGAEAALPPGFPAEALDDVWQQLQRQLAQLVPGARQVIATNSGHYIQLSQPELVIDATAPSSSMPFAAARPSSVPASSPTPALQAGYLWPSRRHSRRSGWPCGSSQPHPPRKAGDARPDHCGCSPPGAPRPVHSFDGRAWQTRSQPPNGRSRRPRRVPALPTAAPSRRSILPRRRARRRASTRSAPNLARTRLGRSAERHLVRSVPASRRAH